LGLFRTKKAATWNVLVEPSDLFKILKKKKKIDICAKPKLNLAEIVKLFFNPQLTVNK
tara:strand:- start:91 stop:264 length:174 start_codon:yes stop_codon:yes gene_type:complete